MIKRIIGSILLILGTSIGAGMLALPVVTAHENFTISAIMLLVAWVVMAIGAFSILEVNLWLEPETNFISMAGRTLGKAGQAITWFVYLILLYSLICAYLSGLSDLLQALLQTIHITIPRWLATLIGLAIFGSVVFRGISSVDMVNRGLMSAKLIIFIVLVALVASHIQINHVFDGDYHFHNVTFMVMLTSFGFATIIPSLRSYLHSDRKSLIFTVLLGSLLPLVIYVSWVFLIQGVVPRDGGNGLVSMMTSQHTNSELMRAISHVISTHWFSDIAKFFVSICALTSFLGVSLCLTDFIADGLNLHKEGRSGFAVFAITYGPPLVIVLFLPGIFIHALAYAGILCLALLIIIPLAMLYVGRYRQAHDQQHLVPGGKPVIFIIGLLMVVLLIWQIVALF